MNEMFFQAPSFNADVSTRGVSSVRAMADMPSWARAFDRDGSKWAVSSVISIMNNMFFS